MKRKNAFLMVLALTISVTGCGKTAENTQTAAGTELAATESMVTQETEAEDAQEASEKEMTPWLNSNVVGAVTENTTAELKDDFYLAVNHDYLETAVPDEGEASKGSFDDVSKVVDGRLLQMMTDDTLEGHDAELMQGLYGMWLDWDSRNSQGMSELMPHIEVIQQIENIDELTEYLISEEGMQYGAYLYDIELGVDAEDSQWHNAEIASIGLSLGDAAEYEKLTAIGERKQKGHRELAEWMLEKAGYTDTEIETILENEYAFEKEIAPSMMTTADWYAQDAMEKANNAVTMEELKEMSPTYPITKFMEATGYGASERINLQEPEWLKKMNELYTEENFEKIKSYLLVNVLTKNMRYLDEETYRKYLQVNNDIYGVTGNREDEKRAVSTVQDWLPASVSKIYAKQYLSEEIRDDVTNIIEEIIDTYRTMLASEEWLSEETREKAISKLDHIKINAVYPDKWEDTNQLWFTSKEDGGSYFAAINELSKCYTEMDKKKINTKVDHEIWDFAITDVNAYYNPSDNSINIIAGILEAPFYRSDMTEEEKLAGIGVIIGHEISHAFDTTGAQFDEDGNFVNWWTEKDFETFCERAGKLIAYYDTIVPYTDGENYPGSNVQGEAIADMGGVKCMLLIAKEKENFDYDAFFRGYAEVWKEVLTKEYGETATYQDSHPLAYLRVNVTIMQQPEFFDTYGIKEGDGMYMAEEDRIAVW